MKKSLSFLLALSATSLLATIASCGKDNGGMDIGDDGEITFKNVNINFSHVITGTDNSYLTQLINEFNQEFKGQIKVNNSAQQPDDLYGNLPLLTANNRNSDVMLIHAERVLQFAGTTESDGTSKYFRELDDIMELAKIELDPSDFPSQVWSNMSLNNEQYGIPFDLHMAGIYVNKTLLAELGYQIEDINSREKIIEASKKAMERGKKGFPISNGYPDTYFYLNGFFNYGGKQIVSEGEDGFDPNLTLSDGTVLPYQPGVYHNDATYKTADSLRELMFGSNKISESQLATDAGVSAFRKGESLFTTDGIWLLKDIERSFTQLNNELGVIPLSTLFKSDKNPDYTGDVYTNGHIFVLPKHTQGGEKEHRQQAAMKFIEWMLEHSTDWAQSGKVAAYKPARETEEYKAIKYISDFGNIDDFVSLQANKYTYRAFSPSQQTTTAVLQSEQKPTDEQLTNWTKQYYDEGVGFIKSDMSGGN